MKAQQFFYGTLAALAVLVIGGGAGYFWATQAIHDQTITLQNHLSSETVVDDQINQLADLKRTYQKLQPLIPQIYAALPQNKQQSVIALQLQSLATSAGMSLPSVNFAGSNTLPNPTSQTVKSGNVLALPVSFVLSGTYPQLQAFLHSVESLNRYTGVSSLTINHKDDKSDFLNFNMAVNVYVMP